MTTVLISNARLVGPATPDVGEEVTVGHFTRAEVVDMVRSGQINHALASLALLTWLTRSSDLG